jgi:hypothetical protein
MAALDGVADLGQGRIEARGGLDRQSRRAPTAQMRLGDTLEFDLADIRQALSRLGCSHGRGDAGQHGGQQGVAESLGIGGVAEQAVRQARLGQAIGVAGGTAAQRRLDVEGSVLLVLGGPVQPGLDPCVGPALGRQHLDDGVGAFDLARLDTRG